jgi:hypothetical protein
MTPLMGWIIIGLLGAIFILIIAIALFIKDLHVDICKSLKSVRGHLDMIGGFTNDIYNIIASGDMYFSMREMKESLNRIDGNLIAIEQLLNGIDGSVRDIKFKG